MWHRLEEEKRQRAREKRQPELKAQGLDTKTPSTASTAEEEASSEPVVVLDDDNDGGEEHPVAHYVGPLTAPTLDLGSTLVVDTSGMSSDAPTDGETRSGWRPVLMLVREPSTRSLSWRHDRRSRASPLSPRTAMPRRSAHGEHAGFRHALCRGELDGVGKDTLQGPTLSLEAVVQATSTEAVTDARAAPLAVSTARVTSAAPVLPTSPASIQNAPGAQKGASDSGTPGSAPKSV